MARPLRLPARTAILLAFTFAGRTGAVAVASAADMMPTYATPGQGFAAAHGERALVMGYPEGLEIWAYPLQLLSGYHVSFRVPGQIALVDGAPLLRRTEYRPTEIVRVYIGPDFVVREHLFVPRKQAAAIVRYEVEGRADVRIEVAFLPSLDLMWPGALGGQTIGWDAAVNGYVEREPLHGFSATIASPEAIGHDAILNRTRPLAPGVRLLLAPGGAARTASVYVTANTSGRPASPDAIRSLQQRGAALEEEARTHVAEVAATSLQIVTPDADVNRALASAVLALDQAWVCNDALGCGEVAGYGPSRPGRRPQYAWFFAGDGLTAMEAMLAAGQYARAGEELAFVTRYQNRQSGMIWHEMSQSAALIDWANKYPYMFVHVDITFQYLASVRAYVQTTGDTRFLRDHWGNIAAAYRYCLSVLDPASGLPRIPADKQGQNEQDRLRDDIRLSTVWIDAADSFATLARVAGHSAQAKDAAGRADLARRSLGRDGWDEARGFWLSGHTLAGQPVHAERPDASGVLLQNVFSQARVDAVLDRIASSEFTTDWGVRSLSAKAADYDPNLYGSGSVWALGTTGVASTFWAQHRPLPAWGMWSALIAWNTLDSAGHLHEVLAGDIFHPEFESVPEQTWSSAALLTSAVHGLLGIEVRSAEHRVIFAPHLPGQWPGVVVRNVMVGGSKLDFDLARDDRGWSLSATNAGADVTLDFDPTIPLGATLDRAAVEGIPAQATLERHAQDSHARLRFTARRGVTRVRIDYSGGVEIVADAPAPVFGDRSRNLRIVGATYADGALSIDAWVTDPERASVRLRSPWTPTSARGARIDLLKGGEYRLTFDPAPAPDRSPAKDRRRATVRIAPTAIGTDQ